MPGPNKATRQPARHLKMPKGTFETGEKRAQGPGEKHLKMPKET